MGDEHSSCVDVTVSGFQSLSDSCFLSICILPGPKAYSWDFGACVQRKLRVECCHCFCSRCDLSRQLSESERSDS